jgi:hypothetical protein
MKYKRYDALLKKTGKAVQEAFTVIVDNILAKTKQLNMGHLLKICLKPSEIRDTKSHNYTSIAVIWIFFYQATLERSVMSKVTRVHKDISIMEKCYQVMDTNYS